MVFIDDQCANCANAFKSASQILTNITVVDDTNSSKIQNVAILDAVLYIYGFSATNLATAFLNYGGDEHLFTFNEVTKTSEYIIEHGLPLCSDCVSAFKDVYLAVHQLKKLSNETSVLNKTIKRFSPTSIKIEADQEENVYKDADDQDRINTTIRHVTNTARSRKTPPEKLVYTASEPEAKIPEDLFTAFNFGQEVDDDCEDNPEIDVKIKTDPLAETELAQLADAYNSSSSSRPVSSRIHLTRRATARLSNTDNDRNGEISKSEIMSDIEDGRKEDDKRRIIKRNMSRHEGGSARLRKANNAKRRKLLGRKRKKSIYRTAVQNKKLPQKTDSVSVSQISSDTISSDYHLEDDDEIDLEIQKDDKKYTILKCSCGKVYTSLASLKHHERQARCSEEPAVCDLCGEHLKKNYLMYAHKAMEHSVNLQILFKCSFCDSKFISRKGLQHHEEKHSTVILESSPSTLKKPEEKTPLLLCSCGSRHRSWRGLRNHEDTHKSEELVAVMCDVCGETFSKNSSLYGHQHKEHFEVPGITLKCNFCEAKYINRSALNEHVKHHHPTTPNSFVCDKCGNTYNTLRNLKRHTLSVHKDENLDKELFRCKQCGISLKHSHSLRKHMSRMHGTQKTFVCPECGKITKSTTNMRIHMKVHDPNRNLKTKQPKLTVDACI